MNRIFLIPAASTMALSLTGCSSDTSIVGNWTASSFTDDGINYPLPDRSTYATSGVDYTYVEGLRLRVQDDGSAALGYYYLYYDSAGFYELDEYLYAGSWKWKGGRALFALSFPEDELDLKCTVEDASARCEGSWFDVPTSMTFVPLLEE